MKAVTLTLCRRCHYNHRAQALQLKARKIEETRNSALRQEKIDSSLQRLSHLKASRNHKESVIRSHVDARNQRIRNKLDRAKQLKKPHKMMEILREYELESDSDNDCCVLRPFG